MHVSAGPSSFWKDFLISLPYVLLNFGTSGFRKLVARAIFCKKKTPIALQLQMGTRLKFSLVCFSMHFILEFSGHFQSWISTRRLPVILRLSPFLRICLRRRIVRGSLRICSRTFWPHLQDPSWQNTVPVLDYWRWSDCITWLPHSGLEDVIDTLQLPAPSYLLYLYVSCMTCTNINILIYSEALLGVPTISEHSQKLSRTSTNDHFSTTATFFVPVDKYSILKPQQPSF